MADQTNVVDIEQELVKLRAHLDTYKTDLLKEAEEHRGKDREEILAVVKTVDDKAEKLAADLKEVERNKLPGLEVVDPKRDTTARDMTEKFSVFRQMKIVAKATVPHSPVSLEDCGYELEAMNQLSLRKKGATAFEIIQHASQNVGQDAAGGVFVPLEVSTSIIPELVATTVAGRAGMQFLTGLSGDMSWPKKVSGVGGQWLDTESEQAITTETLVFGSVRATQHPYAAAVPLTWLMLRQPAISMEAVVRQDLVEKLGLLLDLGAIKGLGQQGQPRGVDLWPDVSTESWSGTQFGSSAGSGGDTTYDTSLDKLRNMHFDLENADALGNGQSLAWIAEPSVAHKLSKTKDRDGNPMYLTKNEANIRTLLGYPLITSTAMSNADTADGFLMFGKWNEAILASWGGMEFAISDSHASNFLTGVVVIRAISSADVVVRQPKAFTSATALTTT